LSWFCSIQIVFLLESTPAVLMRARTPLWTLLRPNEACDRKPDDIGATPRKTPLTRDEKGNDSCREKPDENVFLVDGNVFYDRHGPYL
jgi:hypothetical protein